MDSHLQSLGWSSINPNIVTHQKEACYRLGIWYMRQLKAQQTLACSELGTAQPQLVSVCFEYKTASEGYFVVEILNGTFMGVFF